MKGARQTLVQQIFARNIGSEVHINHIYDVNVDVLMGHDGTATLGIHEFIRQDFTPHDPSRLFLVCDHFSPPATIERAEIQNKLIDWAREHNFDLALNRGICHQLLLERFDVLPGRVVIGADSHTVTSGALGAFATGVGTTDFFNALRYGTIWLKVPHSIGIVFSGQIPYYILGKDMALEVLRILKNDGAIYKSLEYFDYTSTGISIDSRATISNMSVETGAKCGIFYPDKMTYNYLNFRNGMSVDPYPLDAPGNYDTEIAIDCSNLAPLVATPHDPGNVKPVEEVSGIEVSQVFIGSCTGGRLEDLHLTAQLLDDRRVSPYVKVVVIPASNQVYEQAIERGYISTILKSGATISNPSCGPCCNIDKGLLGSGEVCISTSNRNFQGRMGAGNSQVFLASTLTAAASAITGKITDPRSVM